MKEEKEIIREVMGDYWVEPRGTQREMILAVIKEAREGYIKKDV